MLKATVSMNVVLERHSDLISEDTTGGELKVKGAPLRAGWPMQVVLVSATLPGEVLEMTGKFMTEPLRVLVKRDELTLEVCPPCLHIHTMGISCWNA